MNLIELSAKQSINGAERLFVINMDNVTMIQDGESTKPIEGEMFTDSYIRLWFTGGDEDSVQFFGVNLKTLPEKAKPYHLGALKDADAKE